MLLACGSRTPPTAQSPSVLAPTADSGECALVPEPGDPLDTIALVDPVDPANAPRPSNDSERLLFRQLYETLIRVDCRGQALPGLAASWRLDADGRTWIVTLRDGARFADGTDVTATEIRAAWMRDATGDLQPHVSRLVQSVALAGDRALAITLHSRRTDAPMALGHPDLAIAKPADGSPWPLGTRGSRIAPDDGSAAGATARSLAVVRDTLPAMRVLMASSDARDLLDRGADLLITRNPAVLGYAATFSQFQTLPLAWQQTHVLAVPGRPGSAPALSEEQRQMLASDAVRGEARGARAPFWWQTAADCAMPAAPQRAPATATPRIVYDAGDSAARELAERLVGLSRVASPAATAILDAVLPNRPKQRFQRAAGLSGAALGLARRQGADAGYVLSIRTQPIEPCRDLQVLMEGSRWLDPASLVPLVETRPRAIVRRGRSGITMEFDGAVVLTGTPTVKQP